MWRMAKLVAAVGTVAAVLWSCNSPTIPLPPLRAPTFVLTSAPGQWTASGDGLPGGAELFLVNHATGDGTAVRSDPTGAYATPPFGGAQGDVIEVFYRAQAGQYSSSTCTQLVVGMPPAQQCPP